MPRLWASETQNKIELSDQQIADGFIYESEVKSDFFNGAVFAIQKDYRHIFYGTPRSTKGQIVRVLSLEKETFTHARAHWDYYICIKDTNQTPIQGAFLSKKGVWIAKRTQLFDIVINSDWKRITKLVQTPSFEYKYRPTNFNEYQSAIDVCRDIAEIDTSRVDNINAIYDRLKGGAVGVPYMNTENLTMIMSIKYSNTMDLSKWNTGKGANFTNLVSISTLKIDVSTFNTSRATSLKNAFEDGRITSLDVSHWDTSNVTTTSGTFARCRNLLRLDLSKWIVNKITTAFKMFEDCANLASVGWCLDNNFSSLTIGDSMFVRCKILDRQSHQILAPKLASADNMYNGCLDVVPQTILNRNPNLQSAQAMFANATFNETETSIILPSLRNLTNAYGMFSSTNIDSITFPDLGYESMAITNASRMFKNSTLSSVTFRSKWSLGNVTDASYMYENCRELVSFNAQDIQIREIDNAEGMFKNCVKLRVNPYNTKPIGVDGVLKNVKSMYEGCTSLTKINVGWWHMAFCEHYDRMFLGCSNLTSIGDASQWDTSLAVSWWNFSDLSQIPTYEIPPKFR